MEPFKNGVVRRQARRIGRPCRVPMPLPAPALSGVDWRMRLEPLELKQRVQCIAPGSRIAYRRIRGDVSGFSQGLDADVMRGFLAMAAPRILWPAAGWALRGIRCALCAK